MHLYF